MARITDEFGLIRRFFAPLAAGEDGALDLRDDAAVLRPNPGCELVLSADTIIAGVHFPDDADAGDIARRALRVNLSDIAAKGALPRGYLLSLQISDGIDEDWLSAFAQALAQDQETYGLRLLGGDTTRTPGPLAINISIIGQISENKAIRRTGARRGDDVYVTGTIGDAVLGLAILQSRISPPDVAFRDELVSRFASPQPRVTAGPGLVGLAHASADVSDGLVADLGHICEASDMGADIRLEDIPVSDAARSVVTDNQPLRLSLLSGGDDYEIVFTAPVEARADIASVALETGVAMTRIGQIVERGSRDRPVHVLDGAGRELDIGHGGYRHFEREVPQ